MKILLALPYSPCPVRRGTGRLIVNLIKGLSLRHEVILVTMTFEDIEDAALREIEGPNVSVRMIRMPNRRSLAHRAVYKVRNLVLSAVRRLPAQVLYAAPEEFLDLISRTAREERVDLVLVSYWHLYGLSGRLKGTRSVLVTHDIDFLVHAERLRHVTGRVRRFLGGVEARMRERVEREAYRRYESILALTERDADLLGRLPEGAGKVILTLPLAMDLGEYRHDNYVRDRDRILFLGAFGADFNRDALIYFTRDVFPLVLEKRPRARLDVVGYGVDGSLMAEAGSNVCFLGGVDDIRPHLGACSLMILPLRFGGGVRIRMMEAAAMGTPVVSTPTGIAGMGLVYGSDYLEAASPVEMAEAVLRLLENSDFAR
ncbi:MAG: glycosyltransferase, partial [Candidatus Krumholzibacteria bacterium]|nr:glycosyltransferase [Candidatus Krumholzibacteria bacterium]